MTLLRSLRTFAKDPSLSTMAMHQAIQQAHRAGSKPHAFIMVGGLGDIVASEPAIRQLLAPDEFGIILARPNYIGAYSFNPVASAVIPVHGYTQALVLARLFHRIRWTNMQADGVVCTLRKRAVSWPNEAGVTAENYYEFGSLAEVYTLIGCNRNHNEIPAIFPDRTFETARYLAEHFAKPQSPLIGLHTQATEAVRSWPAAQTRMFAEHIIKESDANIIEFGLAPCLTAHPRVHPLRSSLTLPQQFSILSACQTFVGVDSGFAHAAKAAGKSILLMLGQYRHFNNYQPIRMTDDDMLLRARTLSEISPSQAASYALRMISNDPRN